MVLENIEIVRRYYAAWNEAGVRGVLPLWTPDFEWQDAPEMPDSSVYRGADAVLAHFADVEDAIGRMHVEVVQVEAVGNSEVFAALRVRIDGNASGLPFEGPIVEAISLRQGKVSRIRLFLSASEALKAARFQQDTESSTGAR
jgi:ketosteroid isomerase-like protein